MLAALLWSRRHRLRNDVAGRPKHKTDALLFMYWTSDEVRTAPAASAWAGIYANFRVFTDSDVIPLLPADFVSTYQRIRLPSAKSDLARLLLLREYGGFYIDAHIGPTSPADLLATLDALTTFNMVLFGKGWAMEKDSDFDLMNGVLAARKGTPELDRAIDMIIGNIVEQRQKETETQDYVQYDLFGMTGTYVLIRSFFDDVTPRPALKQEFHDTICVHFMKDNQSSGFEIAAYYTYRRPGGHWSERQRNERFFHD